MLHTKEQHRPVTGINHLGQLLQMLGAAAGDGVGKQAQTVTHGQCDAFDFHVTVRQPVVFKQQVNATVLAAIAYLLSYILVLTQFGDFTGLDQFSDQTIGHRGIQSCPSHTFNAVK